MEIKEAVAKKYPFRGVELNILKTFNFGFQFFPMPFLKWSSTYHGVNK